LPSQAFRSMKVKRLSKGKRASRPVNPLEGATAVAGHRSTSPLTYTLVRMGR